MFLSIVFANAGHAASTAQVCRLKPVSICSPHQDTCTLQQWCQTACPSQCACPFAATSLQVRLHAQQIHILRLCTVLMVYQKLGKDCNAYCLHLGEYIMSVLQSLLSAIMPSHLFLWDLQNLSAAVLSVGQACGSAGHQAWLPVGP